jgi:hypothetical protein
MRVIFCPDIFHTQGAAMYAFHSYAAFVARAVLELGWNHQVVAQLPAASLPPFGFGYSADKLFTNRSLHALATAAGFTWRAHSEDCSFPQCDSRIGDRLYVHRGQVVGRNESLKLLAPFQRLGARPLQTFLDGIFLYLRQETLARHERGDGVALTAAGRTLRVVLCICGSRSIYLESTPSLILLITHSLYFMQLHTHTFIPTLP